MGRHKDIQNDKELNITTAELLIPNDYAIRLQLARLKEVEENAERLALDNKKKRMDLEKTNGNLCYLDSTEAEINKVLGPIANLIKNLDQILTVRLHLTGSQTAIVQEVVDDILHQIASIEIQLKSTEEIDAINSHQNSVDREKRIQQAARKRVTKNQ